MENRFEIGSFLLRITAGAVFAVHGFAKFSGGIENTAGWFSSIGLPGFLAYGIALIELIGGICLIIGLGTRIFSSLLAIVMIGAIVKVKLAAGFMGNGQGAGWELDLALLAITLSLAISGSSLLSIGEWIFNRKESDMTIGK
ncbi:membrane protein YfiD [Bacillus methanolicus PB1]|uniref:Membrane protein YfiD n=1 Tax=Bacillus methanolicus PB1 TaxID=997296 RepID=I3DW24_BACMT|nr:DoxX family protein [Bacillus methanolicus]EIJ78445.1 membrane protein YfiD [Bacillus methanolicus PB1]